MRVRLSTILPAPYPEVWALLQRPSTLEYITSPLLRFKPLEPATWPERWRVGQYHARLSFLVVLLLGWQIIDVSHPEAFTLRDNGRGSLARTWDHVITVRAHGATATLYADTVNIDAEVITPLVWLFAETFYRYRQYRWRQLLRERQRRGGRDGQESTSTNKQSET